MKIAMVVSSVPEPNRKLGGVEIFAHRLANELAKKDEVTVFSLSKGAPADALYRHQQLFSTLYRLNQKGLFRRLFLWFGFPTLLNFVDMSRFDVIHIQGDDWFYFFRQEPTLRTMHGSALNEAKTAASLKRKLTQYMLYPLEHLAAKLATITVGVGPDSKKIYGLAHSINNGVDVDRFYPGEKSPNPSILFVGNWQGRKRGHFMFERFTQSILPRVPEARLWMVSDECPSHPNVDSYEYPDDATLARLFREAWVYGYPSIYEGFGITYVEALASGTATVTSHNYGAEHVLAGGKYGIIAEDEHFADQIVALLTDAEKRRRLEDMGCQRATQFRWSEVAKAYRDLYLKAQNSRV
ncbi:MAG: glycosyltransferase family 4 protein [Gemmataceae bacterium]